MSHLHAQEFSTFLSARVLTSPRLIAELVDGKRAEQFASLLRRAVPFIVPDDVVVAAANGLRDLAREPMTHPTHEYVAEALRIEPTLCRQLKALSPSKFEDLLHPVCQDELEHAVRDHGHGGMGMRNLEARSRARTMDTCTWTHAHGHMHMDTCTWTPCAWTHVQVFQEDEIILIVVGGVLGAIAGLVQWRFGWGGPTATARLRTATQKIASRQQRQVSAR